MWKFIRLAAGAALCALFCFVLLVVAVGFAADFFYDGSPSAGGTLQSGLLVTAGSDSWYLSLETQAADATIRTAGHTIVVTPSSLQVDGQTVAAIDPATKAVAVTVRDGVIEFVADNKPVAVWTE
jgi:hypothetical protein